MNVRALATDYDGTIAWHGTVEPCTCRALQQFKDSGRELLLVTGRELPDLFSVFLGLHRLHFARLSIPASIAGRFLANILEIYRTG